MYSTILVRYGELGLKGRNFDEFQQSLLDDIERRLGPYLDFSFDTTYGRIFIYPEDELLHVDDNIIRALKYTPGIVSFSPAIQLPADADLELLGDKGVELLRETAPEGELTFKVETNRANKKYSYNSMEVSKKMGARVLGEFENSDRFDFEVDVHDPEILLEYDVRDNGIFIFTERYEGAGGLPAGTSEKALLLLSGGIDSPVAGWQVIRRGVQLTNLYFHTPPYTGERALEKVRDLTRVLARYNGPTDLYISNITEIQKQIWSELPRSFSVTLLRRMMMRIASGLAEELGAAGIVTGDSIGQVASQTLASLRTISAASELPLLRPLLTADKQDIISQARDIGTYSISIRPYEDCCTLFIPENPITRPRLKRVKKLEEELEIDSLVTEALNSLQREQISSGKDTGKNE